MRGRAYVGTSGWSYPHWRNLFYAKGLPQNRWLAFYAEHFDTVELNNPFYRLPRPETFEKWRHATPKGFVFAVKASRYLTHVRKLAEPNEPWRKLYESARHLAGKLGPILFQFPPNWKADPKRLEGFLEVLPEDLRYAFEFRNPTWFDADVYELLAAKPAALCQADSPRLPTHYEITAPYTFVRMHGGSRLYASEYSVEELEIWAERILGYLHRGIDSYVYFNNDAHGFAVKNALKLKELLVDSG